MNGRLQSLGLNVGQINEVANFLKLDRARQSAALRAAGLKDPGGNLADSQVGDYILGQYLLSKGIEPARAIHLQLLSGKADPTTAVGLLQKLSPVDVLVTDEEIEQQSLAFGGLDPETARLRARLQKAAMMVRPYLVKLVPDLAAVWIDDSGDQPRLVVSSRVASGLIRRVLGGDHIAGIPVELRDDARVGRGQLDKDLVGVREVVARGKVKATVATDPRTGDISVVPTDEAGKAAAEKLTALVGRKEVKIAEPVAVGPSAVVGGHPTALGACTWAFNIISGSQNTPGLATAAHCSNEGWWSAYPTTWQAEVNGGDTDAARHQLSPWAYNQVDNSIERQGLSNLDITGTSGWWNTNYGDVACHSGRSTGWSCGWVNSDNVSPWWVPGSHHFIEVTGPTLFDWGGDSGGPWAYGNSAFGIHSGGKAMTAPNWTDWGLGYYGAIDFAQQDVGFIVLTK